MKKTVFLLLLFPLIAFAQARYDMPVLSTTSSTAPAGSLPPMLAIPNAVISVCGYPATLSAGACTNTITTYTDSTMQTACPATAQLTAAGTSTCTSTTGLQGTFGFWYNPAAQSHLAYTVKTSWGTFGPYDILGGGGSDGASSSPNAILKTTLSGDITSSQTTIPLVSVTGLTDTGVIVIGGEWISYSGISGNNLTPVTRGYHLTTPASASSGTNVFSVIGDFTNPGESPSSYGMTNGAELPFWVFGCSTPDTTQDIIAQFNCDANGLWIKSDGGIEQLSGSTVNVFESQIGIGPGGGAAPIINSGYLLDATRQNQAIVPMGFGAGLAGPVESIQPPTITAPGLTNFSQPSGSTTWSYECTGTDVDGKTFPGTVASITNGPATMTGGAIYVTCPYAAGAASESIWRTAGGPNQGLLYSSTVSGQPLEFPDGGGNATAGSPPATNSSIPKACVASGEVSCWITTATAPTGSCTNGWFDTNQSGSPATLYQCVGNAWTEAGGGAGVTAFNGASGAIVAAAGTNMTIVQTGNTFTFNTAGSAGTGAVGSGSQYQNSYYPNAGSTATVGSTTNEATLPVGLSSSQVTAALGSADVAVTLQPGQSPVQFSNPHNNPIHNDNDIIAPGPWNFTYSGAACDASGQVATITSGSNVITFANPILSAAWLADGKVWVESVGLVGGEQTRFDSKLTYDGSTTVALMDTNAPFTSDGSHDTYVLVGHQDDVPLGAAVSLGISTGREVDLPNGTCWTSTPLRFGANLHGQGSLVVAGGAGNQQSSNIIGSAGEDVLQSPDPVNGIPFPADMDTGNYTIVLNPTIDATKPWQICTSGTCVQQTPLYRPIGILGPDAQDPLAPQWIEGPTTAPYRTGATNGVATMTNGSAVACVPSSETLPAVGQQIVFPYQTVGTPMFETTVASLSGSGCAGGTSPMTLAAAWTPGTPGAPVEWFSGVSFQNSVTAISSSTTINASNPLTITLGNPIIPSPAGVAGVAPFGYIQIDGEQFTYYGNSNFPANSSVGPTITLYSRAQNGTTAASHSIGAIIVPLNAFQPSWPWPVTPSIGGVQTPANAEFFPAQSVGNAAISFPVYNGANYNGDVAMSRGHMHDIVISIGGGSSIYSAQGWQVQNDTAAMYIVPQPFGSTISDIKILNTFYGIVEGAPSTNTNGYFTNGFPTADGNHWTNIFDQSSALPMDIISEGSGMFSGLTFFSESFAPPNNYIPGFTPGAAAGSQGNLMLDSPFDDQSSGYPYNGTGVQFTTFQFKYLEPETGFFNQTQPLDFWNCTYCTWINTTPKGAGVRFIAGNYQQFYGGTIGASSTTPIVITGNNINFDHVIGMGSSSLGYTYGSNAVINFGANNTAVGGGDNVAGTPTGPNVPQMLSDALAPVTGQTDETLRTGNTTAPYVANGLGYFNPFQIQPTSEDADTMTGPWVFDPTSPISQSYTTCAQTAGMGCNPVHMLGDYVYIGAGQRIAPTQYYGHVSLKFPNSTGRTFDLSLLAGNNGTCTGGTVWTGTITATDSNWHDYSIPLADFTNYSGCTFNPIFNSDGVHAFDVQFGYLDLIPLPKSVVLPVTTPTEGAACSQPGSFVGSDGSYIYVCASGGTIKRVGIS